MALLDIFRKKNIKVDSVHATVYAPSNYKILTEQSKGQIVNTKVRFPKELGEAHPFDFKLCEDMTKKIGLVNAIIDKHVDFIMSGGMTIKAEDDRAKKIIDDFMTDFQFDGVIRNFLKETYIKGTGFLELSYGKEGKAGVKSIENMKVLNSNYMYINRDDKGEILGYRQYIGMMKEFGKNPNEVTDFAPEEIACLTNNKIGDCAYGTGMVFPLIMLVDDLAGARKEMHMLMKRKANTPIIFTGGNREKDEFPTQGEMDSLGERLEWLTNKHEWVVSDFWKASTP